MGLKVSSNKRYLVHDDGKETPFFYLGDTAWELFHRLNREEADYFLKVRAEQKFNVIQAVVLAEFDGVTDGNAYGELPLKDRDPTKPLEPYFEHVDWIINRAEELGMWVGLLPTWGDKVTPRPHEVPPIFNPDNAGVFGEYLGKRYRDKKIIWILGGDRPISTDTHLAVWRAMAAGIKRGDGGRHLMTYHPNGWHSSSQYVHNEPWLDFNMLQSGHYYIDQPNYDMIRRDYIMFPVKPTIDAEPRYENHPVMGNYWPTDHAGWFDHYDVRKAAYWALFSGAFGHTYGCHDVWQMWDEKRKRVNRVRTPWREAVHLPGANQMQHARKLMESRSFDRVPHMRMVNDSYPGGPYIAPCHARDGSHAYIYLPTGQTTKVKLDWMKSDKGRVLWFNPRDGQTTEERGFDKKEWIECTPPTNGYGNDWVLILESI